MYDEYLYGRNMGRKPNWILNGESGPRDKFGDHNGDTPKCGDEFGNILKCRDWQRPSMDENVRYTSLNYDTVMTVHIGTRMCVKDHNSKLHRVYYVVSQHRASFGGT